MRVLHLCESWTGGAGAAALRLHRGLRARGVDSLCGGFGTGAVSDPGYCPPGARARWKRWLCKQWEGRVLPRLTGYGTPVAQNFSPRGRGVSMEYWMKRARPGLVHLHWINKGCLDLRGLKGLKVPVVWTFHDMWPFTGGCHYSGDCHRYEQVCGECPLLPGSRAGDLSDQGWRLKDRVYGTMNLHGITPSRWMAELARSSSLWRERPVTVIPNGVDERIFKPGERRALREKWGLDPDGRYLLFAAADAVRNRRKGFDLLLEAMRRLGGAVPFELLVAGSEPAELLGRVPERVRAMGRVGEESVMAELYALADGSVLPARQDNFPNTVLESMACGTPVAAFASGGVSEMLVHGESGYLAAAGDVVALGAGLRWLLEAGPEAGVAARQRVERLFSIERQAEDCAALYRSIGEVSHER